MFKNYIVTAFRNLKNNLSHTAINVIGLALGLACCLVVFTIINFEYSFDDWHKEKANIYRITNTYYGDNRTSHSGIIAYPTGKVLTDEIPEIENVVLFQGPDDAKFSFTNDEGTVEVYAESGVLMTNSAFFEVLDFELIEGQKEDLQKPFQIFLSETLASKYFPKGNPVGKTIVYDGENNLTVAGIVQDSPENTNLPYTCLISFETLKKTEPNIWENWGMTWAHSIYIKIASDTDPKALAIKIDETLDKHRADDEQEAAKTEVVLQPLAKIHNEEKYGDGYHYVTPSLLIWAFVFLGGLILGTACLNFINLNTAQAIKRSKEVGIRKTLGSNKQQLVVQFLMETLVIVSVAMLLALSLGQFLIQQFNKLVTTITYNLHYSNEVILFSLTMIVLVSILAGFYPSMILSGYRPVEALKNKINLTAGSGNFNLRRSLVVAQFIFTTVMLIGTLIIAAQVDFMKSKDLGFNPNNVIKIQTPSESKQDPRTLLEQYQTKNYVEDATLSFTSPMDWSNWNNSYRLDGTEYEDGNNASIKFVDANYMDFYEIPLLGGRGLQNKTINDSTYDVIVTKKLLETLDIKSVDEAIGQVILQNRRKCTIVGVAEDFSVFSAHNEVRPVVLSYRPGMMYQIALKLPSNNVKAYIGDIEETFRAFYPNELFEFAVFKNEIAEQYMMEDLLHHVIQFVSFLAIVLSGMGLYGLVSFIANRNAKIIGIRKVFGASTAQILTSFTKEYIKLMLIAFLIAGPIAYFLMNIWIQEFAFRIDLSPKYFFMGFFITFIIAILTVGYRSMVAARANPIQSLRYE